MKLQPYVTKLNSSKEYKQFQGKHKDAFLTAGFFVLDLEGGKNMHQVDYYVPSENKIEAFTLDGQVTLQMLSPMAKGKKPEKLDINTKIDLDALSGILKDEMHNRNITEDIKKIIAILQSVDGKKIWNLNCILSGMELLRAHVEDDSKTVLKMDRSSVFDYIKKVPASMLQNAQGQAQAIPGMDAQTPGVLNIGKKSSKDISQELEKLEKLEQAIEKEKVILQSEMKKEESVAKVAKPKAASAKSKKTK